MCVCVCVCVCVLENEMATHSSVLASRIPGTGEPGGLLSMGSHGAGHDWSDLAAAAYIYTYISWQVDIYIYDSDKYRDSVEILILYMQRFIKELAQMIVEISHLQAGETGKPVVVYSPGLMACK